MRTFKRQPCGTTWQLRIFFAKNIKIEFDTFDNKQFSKEINDAEQLEKISMWVAAFCYNAFYAENNYVFKDSALNDFFSSAVCYFPDESITQNSIKISKEERILIEMIQTAENGKSPEEVFNKYKK